MYYTCKWIKACLSKHIPKMVQQEATQLKIEMASEKTSLWWMVRNAFFDFLNEL